MLLLPLFYNFKKKKNELRLSFMVKRYVKVSWLNKCINPYIYIYMCMWEGYKFILF